MSTPNGRHAFAVVGQVGCIASCGDLTHLSSPNRFTVMQENTVRGRGGFLIDSEPAARAVDPAGHNYGCAEGVADLLMQGNRLLAIGTKAGYPLGPAEGFFWAPGRGGSGALLVNNSIVPVDVFVGE